MQETMQDTWFRFIRNIEEEEQDLSKSKLWSFIYEASSTAATAVFVIFILFTFVFRAVGVVGNSMLPTLSNGDWLLVMPSSTVSRGDVIVSTEPNKLDKSIVKRVIAIEGDVVNIDFYLNQVSVNGQVLDEKYISEPIAAKGDVEFPLTVPAGKVFVLGDNRNDSTDSRWEAVGCVDVDYILGTAEFKILPKPQKIN